MSYRIVYDSDPKYLAACDILIGDMSDINYEFLVFNRPIILLANEWVNKEFPDIGIKSDLSDLEESIQRSIKAPLEYEENRELWLNKTHFKPDGKSSERVLDKILEFSKIKNPRIIFIHGNNEVLRNTVKPIFNEAISKGLYCEFTAHFSKMKHKQNNIYVSSHNELLDFSSGIKVHVDHGNKGPGVSPLDYKIEQWKNNNYWCNTDLFITEGEISQDKTKKCLASFSEKAVMVGFPRSDDYLRLNTLENKMSVCRELSLDHKLPLVVYAPAGKYSFPYKQGASLSRKVIKEIKKTSKSQDFNILVKLKYPRYFLLQRIINKIISSR
jgi:CDP-glycerol glycerophosphotransferase (TagB/SpsB family)